MRLLTAVVTAAMIAGPARAGDLVLSFGAFDVTDDTYRAVEAGARYGIGERWWRLRPIVGAMATSAGAFHAYVGFALEVALGEHVVLGASLAPGYYNHGGRGKGLGDPLEFRSGIELAWHLGRGRRLGVEVYHLSNQDLGAINPGQGSLVLTLSLPLGS